MSVYFWHRNNTTAEFVMKARELRKVICQAVANSNRKQYGVYGAGKLVEYACELYRMTVKANFRPTNEQEVLLRYRFLIQARQEFSNVVAQFGDTSELMNFSEFTLDKVSLLMAEEEKLLSGVIKSDRERYAKYLSKI